MYVVKHEPENGIAVALDEDAPQETAPDNPSPSAKVALIYSD